MDIFWNYTTSVAFGSRLAQLYNIIGALGSLESTTKAERVPENIHNSPTKEISSPHLSGYSS